MPKGSFCRKNINLVAISFLIVVMTIVFISQLVSCFPVIGGDIFSGMSLGNGQKPVLYGTCNMYISMKYE